MWYNQSGLTDQHTGKATASEMLAKRLRYAIFEGEWLAGDRLPTERDLAEAHNVSRHVVREALKRLQAIGLVSIRPGSGCYVNDVHLVGGLELLEEMLTGHDGRLDLDLVGDIFEFRAHVAREAIRLAALRRTDEEARQLEEAVRERRLTYDDVDRLSETNTRIFRLLAAAAGNRVYQLAFNNLGRILVRIRQHVPFDEVNPAGPQEDLERIVEAVREKDPEMAGLYVERQTRRMKELLHILLARLARERGVSPSPED